MQSHMRAHVHAWQACWMAEWMYVLYSVYALYILYAMLVCVVCMIYDCVYVVTSICTDRHAYAFMFTVYGWVCVCACVVADILKGLQTSLLPTTHAGVG